MKKNQIVWTVIIAVVCISLYLIPTLYFHCHLSKYGLSTDPARWGQYGDFIGGITNPILSIVSIIALISLTFTVSHSDDKRTAKNIRIQELTILTQMRHNVVSELSKTLDLYTKIPEDVANKRFTTALIINAAFNSFSKSYTYLFAQLYTDDFKQQFYTPLNNSITKLNISSDLNTKEELDKFLNVILEYSEAKDIFIAELNKYIIQQMSSTK